MHILVYQKKRSDIDEDPDMLFKAFDTRRELMQWALNNGIRLYYKKALLINGETGEEERGTMDIRSEIARLEAEELVTADKEE